MVQAPRICVDLFQAFSRHAGCMGVPNRNGATIIIGRILRDRPARGDPMGHAGGVFAGMGKDILQGGQSTDEGVC